MTPIEPAKLSKSFRNIAKQKSRLVYYHAVRCNDKLDGKCNAISDDQKYLAMNLALISISSSILQVVLWKERAGSDDSSDHA